MLTTDERKKILRREPALEKFTRRYVGGNEFINNVERYCFWLVDATPNELSNKEIYRQLEGVKNFRLASKATSTRKFAETPHLFCQIAQPTIDYLLIPQVSSERRKYIPIGFLSPKIICNAQALIIPAATIYHFGILTSSIHMAWMRTVSGRLEMRYMYSPSFYYNFPWPTVDAEQKILIEQTAQNILDVRAKYQGNREVGK